MIIRSARAGAALLTSLAAAAGLAGSVAVAQPADAAPVGGDGRVVARSGLVVRSAPSSHAKATGFIRSGSLIPLSCKINGTRVDGNRLWYALPGEGGEYVSARYVENVGRAPGVCRDTVTGTGRTTAVLSVREGPSTADRRTSVRKADRGVSLICSLAGQRVGAGDQATTRWYLTAGGGWLSARYVRLTDETPVHC